MFLLLCVRHFAAEDCFSKIDWLYLDRWTSDDSRDCLVISPSRLCFLSRLCVRLSVRLSVCVFLHLHVNVCKLAREGLNGFWWKKSAYAIGTYRLTFGEDLDFAVVNTLCSEKNTHSRFLSYLRGKCLYLCKIFTVCLWRIKYSKNIKK